MESGAETRQIESLKAALKESVKETVNEIFRGGGQGVTDERPIFPLYTCREVGRVFKVSPRTVKDWHRRGLLRGRYQVLSGRSCRLIFANNDLLNFFDENFPSLDDLGDHPCSPRRGSKAARLVAAMFKMNALYARRRQRVKDDEEG